VGYSNGKRRRTCALSTSKLTRRRYVSKNMYVKFIKCYQADLRCVLGLVIICWIAARAHELWLPQSKSVLKTLSATLPHHFSREFQDTIIFNTLGCAYWPVPQQHDYRRWMNDQSIYGLAWGLMCKIFNIFARILAVQHIRLEQNIVIRQYYILRCADQ